MDHPVEIGLHRNDSAVKRPRHECHIKKGNDPAGYFHSYKGAVLGQNPLQGHLNIHKSETNVNKQEKSKKKDHVCRLSKIHLTLDSPNCLSRTGLLFSPESQNFGLSSPLFITPRSLFASIHFVFQRLIITFLPGIKVANLSLDYCSVEPVALKGVIPEAGLQQP